MEPTEKHLAVLKKFFGHKEFRPMQWQIIRSIIEERRDNCVIMATGYGKSLCYQYPPVFCEGLGIVISPLISLMQDQVLSLKMRNISACFLGSAQTDKSVIDNLLKGDYRLVYVTPEWCTGEYGEEILSRLPKNGINITLIAIDEAHCVSQWGHDFRKSYRYLGKLRRCLPEVPIVTLTATATPQVRKDIISSLCLRNPQQICTSFDRPNLFLSVSLKGSDLLSDIRGIINKHKIEGTYGPTIIYCPTKKMADKIYTTLRVAGFKCNMYHAGLSSKVRERAHEEFVKDTVEIIIATVAFGMGIDKPDVRLVIHYGAPKDIESYYQEIGRAGRDGLPSVCHTFYAQTDFTLNRSFISALTGNFKTHKEDMQRMMERYLQAIDCRRKILLKHFSPNFKFDENRDVKSCCDNCARSGSKARQETDYDLTEDALLLLRAVREMSQKYGLNTYILLLRGSSNKRLPQKFHSSELFGAGTTKSEGWWKLLGGLLLRESLLEETISDFGQGWNKNNFPVKIVKITAKGNHYMETHGEIAHLEPTPEMLTIIHKMPRKTEDGWLIESIKNNPEYIFDKSDDTSNLRNASLEDALFEELLKFRTEMAEKLHCMPYMVLDNRSIQDLTVKRPKTIEELSSIEGINEAKIKNFGKECLECIAKVVESQGSGTSSSNSNRVVSAKRFVKNFVFKPPPKVFRYEDETEELTTEEVPNKINLENESKKSINQPQSGSQEELENSLCEDDFDQDILSAVDEIELKANSDHSEVKSEALSLKADLSAQSKTPQKSPEKSNVSETSFETSNSHMKRKKPENSSISMDYVKHLIQINEEKKKAGKKRLKIL